MDGKIKLENICREEYNKVLRAERVRGFDDVDTRLIRAQWAAFDKAYNLVYGERVDYYNVCIDKRYI